VDYPYLKYYQRATCLEPERNYWKKDARRATAENQLRAMALTIQAARAAVAHLPNGVQTDLLDELKTRIVVPLAKRLNRALRLKARSMFWLHSS